MKTFIAAILLSLALLMPAQAEERPYRFSLEGAVVTGLVYGPGIEHGAAIVDDKILYEGSLYHVKDGKILGKVAGERVLAKIPASEILRVGQISKDGVMLSYQGKSLTLKLKGK